MSQMSREFFIKIEYVAFRKTTVLLQNIIIRKIF